MSGVMMVYVTYPEEVIAREVSRAVVEEGLAACANIFPAHRSVYRWKGAVEEAGEVAVIYKTRGGRFEALQAAIIRLHPYECPCVVAWEISAGAPAFLEWIAQETM